QLQHENDPSLANAEDIGLLARESQRSAQVIPLRRYSFCVHPQLLCPQSWASLGLIVAIFLRQGQRSQEDAEQPARQVSVAEVVEKGDRLHSGGGDQEEVAWEKEGMDPHLLLQRNKWQIKTVLVPHSEADTKMKPKDNILEMHKVCEIKTAINTSAERDGVG
ncbi:hypothetical protein U0070_001204, partial [Myodes glareolus]